MKIDSSQQYAQVRTVHTPVHHRGMLVAALAASFAFFLFSGPSLAQNSAAKPASKTAAPVSPAATHAPAVAYLLLQSAQGPLNGNSTDATHRNWIAVSAIDKGGLADAAAPGVPALDAGSKDAAKMAGATGSSSGSHSDSFSIRKEIDEASPLLARAAASGNHFSSAQLDVLDGGVWHHYQLSDVTVSSVQAAGGGNRPSEQIHLTFQKIEMK